MASGFQRSESQLLRVLGPIGATTIVVGSVIGSGIFFKANVIAQNVGRFDLVLLVWIVCGLMSLMGALAAAELGAMMPRAGGQYVYLREAYGPLTGFLWGWGEFWMMRTGSTAALAVAFSTAFYRSLGNLLHHVGWLRPESVNGTDYEIIFGHWTVPQVWVLRLIAIVAIVLLAAVNVAGARWGGLMQNVTTFAKAGTLVAIMVLPFVTGVAEPSNWTTRVARTGDVGLIAGFGAAMTAAFWAYDGWGNIGPVAEEVRDPQRNIPLSLLVGMFILITLYVGATVSYHLVLTVPETAGSKFVAASAFEAMLGRHGAAIASAAVMVSTFGALNSNLFVGPRIIFAMARDRLFLSPMARVHPRFRTPHWAIIGETGWAIVLILGADLLTRFGHDVSLTAASDIPVSGRLANDVRFRIVINDQLQKSVTVTVAAAATDGSAPETTPNLSADDLVEDINAALQSALGETPFAGAIRFRSDAPRLTLTAGPAIWKLTILDAEPLGFDSVEQAWSVDWISSTPSWLASHLGRAIGGMRGKALFDVLTDYVIFGQFVFYLLATAAVFVLRVKRPDWPRPYKTWGYPVLPLIFVVSSGGFLIGMFATSPVESVIGLTFIGLGAAAYQFRPRDNASKAGSVV